MDKRQGVAIPRVLETGTVKKILAENGHVPTKPGAVGCPFCRTKKSRCTFNGQSTPGDSDLKTVSLGRFGYQRPMEAPFKIPLCHFSFGVGMHGGFCRNVRLFLV